LRSATNWRTRRWTATRAPRGCPSASTAFKSPATGLVYFRNRWLSTRTGEWLSQDPLGAVDSANLYAFNAFDAVNFWDPMGLKKGETGIAVVSTGSGGPPPSPEIRLGGITGPGVAPGPGAAPAAAPLCDAECKRELGGREPDGTGRSGYLGDGLGLVVQPSPVTAIRPKARPTPPPAPPPSPLERPLHELSPEGIRAAVKAIPEGEFDNLSGDDVDGRRMNRAQRNAARGALNDAGKKWMADTFLDFADEEDRKQVEEGNRAIGEYASRELQGIGWGKAVAPVVGGVVTRIGPRWRARAITDPACRTGCERVASQIQKHIGGEIKRIVPADPRASNLGSYRGSNPGWAHHDVVVKEGRVYDAFTDHRGASISDYKALWENADAINFGF